MGDRKQPTPPPGDPGYVGPAQVRPEPPPCPPRASVGDPVTADFVAMIARRNGVPDGLMEGLGGYVALGHRPGHFLAAVLENNLIEAVRRADAVSSAGLVALAIFIHNYLPAASYGSPTRVAAWIAHGGMRQFETADKAGA